MDACQHLDLRLGVARAVVCRTGAALVRLEVGGSTVVDGAGGGACAPGQFRGSVLAPWPGRLEDGRYEHAGRLYEVPVNEPGTGSALHGLVADRRWDVEEVTADAVVLSRSLGGDAGYPFGVALAAAYALRADGVEARLTAVNRDRRPVPIGLGSHPYLVTGTTVDGTTLHLPAAAVVALDARGLPGEPAPTADSAHDFRAPRPVGGAELDHVFTDLDRDPAGWVAVTLGGNEGAEVTLSCGPTAGWVTVFTSDTLEPPARRSAIAVEPQTCPPNAFRSGRDLELLPPGGSLHLDWRLRALR